MRSVDELFPLSEPNRSSSVSLWIPLIYLPGIRKHTTSLTARSSLSRDHYLIIAFLLVGDPTRILEMKASKPATNILDISIIYRLNLRSMD